MAANTNSRYPRTPPYQQASDNDDDDDDDEETALLLNSFLSPSPLLDRKRPFAKDLYFRAILTTAILVVVLDVAAILQIAPSVRLFEIIYCREYYELHNPRLIDGNGTVAEELCKVDAVQHKLASLRGWLSFFGYLPGVFLAIPYGILADKYGRKWFLFTNLVAFAFACAWQYLVCAYPQVLPIRSVWLLGITRIFGGGSLVLVALFYCVANDVSPKSQLTITFFRLNAANLFAYSAAPLLTGVLMQHNVWLPMNIGVFLQFLAIPICLALPETLGLRKEDDEPISSSNSHSDVNAIPDHLSSSPPPSINFDKGDFWKRTRFLFTSALCRSAFLFRDWRILCLNIIYLFWGSVNNLDELIMQYIPKRYHWSFARTTYLFSIQNASGMLTLAFLLPWISSYLLRKTSFNPTRKDLFLLRAGLAFAACGLLLQGLAPHISLLLIGLLLQSLGAGINACMRALLTSYVQKNEVARLYSAIALVTTAGFTIGGPVMAGIFNAGLERAETGNSVWLGLPWMVEAAVVGVFAVAVCVLPLHGTGEEKDEGARQHGMFPDGVERASEIPGVGGGGGMAVVVVEEGVGDDDAGLRE